MPTSREPFLARSGLLDHPECVQARRVRASLDGIQKTEQQDGNANPTMATETRYMALHGMWTSDGSAYTQKLTRVFYQILPACDEVGADSLASPLRVQPILA